MKEREIFVVDDDALMRDVLAALLADVGCTVRVYGCADAFLAENPQPSGVLLLDLRLKGMSGMLLQQRLQGHSDVQIIFMSGVAEVEDAVSAMKAGAYEFLVKPFRPQTVIDAVGGAFERLRQGQVGRVQSESAKSAYQSLTAAEREIAQFLARGLPNKQVAYFSGRAESTVKVHRARIMQKMGANSLVELVGQLQCVATG